MIVIQRADVATFETLVAASRPHIIKICIAMVGYIAHRRQRGIAAYLALVLSGLALLVMGSPLGLIGADIAIFVYGTCMSVFGLIWVNTLQELVPLNMMGRVSCVDMLGSFVLLPVGYALAGWLTDLVGPATVFVVGGILTMFLIGLGLLHPAIRNLD